MNISGYEFERVALDTFSINGEVFVAPEDDYGNTEVEETDEEVTYTIKAYGNGETVASLTYTFTPSEVYEDGDFSALFDRSPSAISLC